MMAVRPESLMSRTILIADDDPHIRELLAFALKKAGYATREAGDGEAALAMVAAEAPDLLVLDINMPRMDGLEACRRLRASSDLPVLFLSSRDDELDRVLGLEIGADDYVVKPFSPREVVARVGAILKRLRPREEAVAAAVGHGRLTVDTEAFEARWDGAPVALTATELHLLMVFVRTPNKVFSRDEIIDRLHGPGFAVTDRTIDSHIRNIRAKFAVAGGTDLIETRAGIGYRLGTCRGEGA
jgi:two-component system OmpR family response regulator